MSTSNINQQDLTRQAKLLQFANMKRRCGEFNDVTIRVGAECISANRMVLACFSKFFESMFRSPLKEKYQNSVEIKELDGEAVKAVIEFIYSGKIVVRSNNVLALLGVAEFLQIDEVKKTCFDYMVSSLTVDSCLNVVKAAVLYNNPSSLQQTYQFISERFAKIVATENFKDLSKSDLMSLFSSIDRGSVETTALYSGMMNWVKHDRNRESEFSSLFLTLELGKLSGEFMINTVINEPLIKSNVDCLNAVVSYMAVRIEKTEEEKKASKILCVGGEKIKSVLEVYNVLGKPLTTYPDLPHALAFHCLLKFQNFIFCVGGTINGDCDSTLNNVYRLNFKKSTLHWEQIASKNERRCDFGACVINGSMIVAGGYSNGWWLQLWLLQLCRNV